MAEEWQAKLQRLGVVKGVRELKRPPILPDEFATLPQKPELSSLPAFGESPQPLTTLLPGLQRLETADGGCYLLDQVFPLSHQHGEIRLGALLELMPAETVPFHGDSRLSDLTFADFLFLDTETTGLMGAGAFAFLVGIGFYENNAYVLRQYFLQDHDDEYPMLTFLAEHLSQKPALLTFNGRSFDIPLLDRRYLMNRIGHIVPHLRQMPHLDILPPSRRLWQLRLGSCALSQLEKNLLNIQRTQEDIPGWLIPRLYEEYLQHGNGQQMARVFYHNCQDILSMTTLAAQLVRQWSRPYLSDHPMDYLSLAKWQIHLGMAAKAESYLRHALTCDLPLEQYQETLLLLASLLKQQERRTEALPFWQQLAVTSYEDVTAHIELAKYHEWHSHDLPSAQHWTEEALRLANCWQPTRAEPLLGELAHRLARLWRKQERDTP